MDNTCETKAKTDFLKGPSLPVSSHWLFRELSLFFRDKTKYAACPWMVFGTAYNSGNLAEEVGGLSSCNLQQGVDDFVTSYRTQKCCYLGGGGGSGGLSKSKKNALFSELSVLAAVCWQGSAAGAGAAGQPGGGGGRWHSAPEHWSGSGSAPGAEGVHRGCNPRKLDAGQIRGRPQPLTVAMVGCHPTSFSLRAGFHLSSWSCRAALM